MKILALDGVDPKGVEIMGQKFEVVERAKITPEELLKIIPDFDAMVVRSATKVTKEVIAAAANLKIIGRAGVGVDNIDVEAATNRGIVVINSPGGNTMAATEHTVGMILALARHIPQAYRSLREGRWDRKKYVGIELRDKVLGVIGLGRIGAGVAKRAQAMEMKVIAYDPFITPERAKDMDIEVVALEEIFKQADFITVHVPKTKDTKSLIDKKAFAIMKDGVRLINVARGGIINEMDLVEAVNSGKVAGAAIDVFEEEPVNPEHPLLHLDNVIVTPHLGASTEEAQVGVSLDVADGIVRYLQGGPIRTAVNLAPVSAEVMNFIQPYFQLAERLGCLAIHLAEGPVNEVEVSYSGDLADKDVKLLTTTVLKGLLNPILTENINLVNAPVLAKARGIKVKEVRIADVESNVITVTVKTAKQPISISGTLFGKTDPRVIRINDYRVDFEPTGWLLIAPHSDKPGMVGKLGGLFGEYSINIASMQVGRTANKGTSIMVIAVENEVSNEVMMKIKGIDGIFDARLVSFEDIKE